MIYDAMVIGAGQAGLAAAYALQQSGVSFCVLEASDRTVGSWPSYYDSLTLFSPARYSSLLGWAFPGDPERYPSRQEVIDYLDAYARHFAFPIILNTRVSTIEREGEIFAVHTDTGKCWQARTVIVASGSFRQPNIPDFPGLAQFKGKILHSADYHQPSDIEGKRVAIVGAGNSAVQIAYELRHSHEVILTSRTPPKFINQRPLGKDVHFWLSLTGLDTLPLGRWLKSNKAPPVLDQGRYRQALESGQISYKPLFERIDASGLSWSDTTRAIDTILLATGFVHRPPYLDGLDGYDAATAAQHRGGVATHIAGLYFIGVAWQRSHASATLRGVGADAQHIVRQLQHYLARPSAVPKRRQGCC